MKSQLNVDRRDGHFRDILMCSDRTSECGLIVGVGRNAVNKRSTLPGHLLSLAFAAE
jgi:hypothetical protein